MAIYCNVQSLRGQYITHLMTAFVLFYRKAKYYFCLVFLLLEFLVYEEKYKTNKVTNHQPQTISETVFLVYLSVVRIPCVWRKCRNNKVTNHQPRTKSETVFLVCLSVDGMRCV